MLENDIETEQVRELLFSEDSENDTQPPPPSPETYPFENTVKVTNLSEAEGIELSTQLSQFFSHSGKISNLYLGEDEEGKFAYVSFVSPAALSTAVALSGTLINQSRIVVTVAEGDIVIPESNVEVINQEHLLPAEERTRTSVIASLLAQGYKLTEDSLASARKFDEENGITTKLKKVASDINDKVTEIDEKLGVSSAVFSVTDSITQKGRELDESYKITQKSREFTEQATEKLGEAIQGANAFVATTSTSINNFVNTNETVQSGIQKASAVGSSVTEKAGEFANYASGKISELMQNETPSQEE